MAGWDLSTGDDLDYCLGTTYAGEACWLIFIFHPSGAVFNACYLLHRNLKLTHKPDREIPQSPIHQHTGPLLNTILLLGCAWVQAGGREAEASLAGVCGMPGTSDRLTGAYWSKPSHFPRSIEGTKAHRQAETRYWHNHKRLASGSESCCMSSWTSCDAPNLALLPAAVTVLL